MDKRRAPKGYRIVEWKDGVFHVYWGMNCICEAITRGDAIRFAEEDKKQRKLTLDSPDNPDTARQDLSARGETIAEELDRDR